MKDSVKEDRCNVSGVSRSFEERLKQLRENTRKSQKETAMALGITTRQYQRFESGEQRPGYDNLIRIADHFHVSLDWLTGRRDTP